MDENNQLNIWTIGAVIAIALIAFLIIWAWGPFRNSASPAMPIAADAGSDSGSVIKAIDQAKLAADYKAASDKIFAEYIAAVSADPKKIASLSSGAKNALLGLTLPSEYKDRHLSEVILLGEIASLSQSGKTSEAEAKLSQLKAIINQ